MALNTYFGFFAEAVFKALGQALGEQAGVALEAGPLHVRGCTGFSLRREGLERLLIPVVQPPAEVRGLFLCRGPDAEVLKRHCGGGIAMHRALEQAVSVAWEPFQLINRQRGLLAHLDALPNVPGLVAHQLGGGLHYTLAECWFRPQRGAPFALALLVTPQGRDGIEKRAAQPQTIRALQAIVGGAYRCRPQRMPPPAEEQPPEGRQAQDRAPQLAWLHSLFCANSAPLPLRLFRRTAALRLERQDPAQVASWSREQQAGAGLHIVRLGLEGHQGSLLALFPQEAGRLLLTLSKSGREDFYGGLLRALFGASAGLWTRFSGQALAWRVLGQGRMELAKAAAWLAGEGAQGLLLRQTLALDEQRVAWWLSLRPPLLHELLQYAARPLGLPPGQAAGQALVQLGLHSGVPPLQALLPTLRPQEALQLLRLLGGALEERPGTPAGARRGSTRGRAGPAAAEPPGRRPGGEDHSSPQELAFAAAHASLARPQLQELLLGALPLGLRERVASRPLNAEARTHGLRLLAGALARVQGQAGLPGHPLAAWGGLYAEALWWLRQQLLEAMLPLRLLVFGMDRESLQGLLPAIPRETLSTALCGVEFPVLDQVRRAAAPAFALRLLEDLAQARTHTTPLQAQQAQLAFLRHCGEHLAEGRLLLRPTPARALHRLLAALEDWP